MVKCNLLVFFFFFFITSMAQSPSTILNVTIKNEQRKAIDVIKPVVNAVFWAAKKTIPLDKDGRCSIDFDSTETGYVMFFAQGKRINLFIRKGDTIDVVVDTANMSPVFFSGNNALGQALLNDKEIPINYSSVKDIFSKDTSLRIFAEHIEQEKITKINRFGSLYDQRNIDSTFFSFAKLNLDYLYATVILERVSDEFYKVFYPTNHPLHKPNYNKEYENYWQLILQYFPPDNDAAVALPSMEAYIDHYINHYLVDYKRWLAKDTARISHDEYLLKKMNVIRLNFKGKMADITEARRLYLNYIQQKFEKPLIELYENFARRTTLKKYLLYLKPYHEKVVAYQSMVSKDFDSKQVFVTNYIKINHFNELKEQLKGSIYYVDIWATWCGPCKEEFKYKDTLNNFFNEHKIKILYLSMDKDDSEIAWRTMIKYYKLKGVHLRTNDALRADLSNVFWGGGYAIPRYLLIGKDGNILESDAARPSQPEKLKEQIKKHLK